MPDRGSGYLFQPTYTARDGSTKTSAKWWLRISVNGKKVTIPTGTTDLREAQRFQKRKAGELAGGQTAGILSARITLDQLEQRVLDDYKNNGRTSSRHVVQNFRHLKRHLGRLQAHQIDEDVIERYKSARVADGAAKASVNLELASLQRGLNLCQRKLPRVPAFTYLDPKNARQGFFERADFEAILRQIPEARGKRRDLSAPLEVAYITGWRLHSELLTRQWHHVDFDAGWLRLDPREAKNEEGRMFPLIDELRAILNRQREWTDEVERLRGRVIPWVFHRWGKPITSIQKAWENARAAAGQPNRLVHDFRRTAVRNLERAGVPRSWAMKMVGHKTEAIYRRYAIVEETVLIEGGDRLSEFLSKQKVTATAKVLPIKG